MAARPLCGIERAVTCAALRQSDLADDIRRRTSTLGRIDCGLWIPGSAGSEGKVLAHWPFVCELKGMQPREDDGRRNTNSGRIIPQIAKVAFVLVSAMLSCGRLIADDPGKAQAPAQGGTKTETEADLAWKKLQALQPPVEPGDWSTHTPTDEERREFQRKQAGFACLAADLARNFYTRFPDHDMSSEAMSMEQRLLNGPLKADVLEYRVNCLERDANSKGVTNEGAILQEFEKGIRELLKGSPDHFVPNQALLKIARQMGDSNGLKLAREVRDARGVPDFVKEEAAELLKKLDAVGKPFVIKFTAVDGMEIDLQQFNGKVVLLDYWATWCVPCVAELPQLKALYEKLHADGFEILGISLDEKETALRGFVEKEKISWPQFCDGKGWQNRFAQQWAIKAIPTLWLVDRKGILRSINARSGLEEKVRKLLAEPL